MLANLLEGHTVAPIILAGSSKTHTTVRKHLAHYLRNFAHAIVVRSIANIEYFIVNRFGGNLQHCGAMSDPGWLPGLLSVGFVSLVMVLCED